MGESNGRVLGHVQFRRQELARLQTRALLSQCIPHRLGLYARAHDTTTLHTHLLSGSAVASQLAGVHHGHLDRLGRSLRRFQLVHHDRQRARSTPAHFAHVLLDQNQLQHSTVSIRSHIRSLHNPSTRRAHNLSRNCAASQDTRAI